jgi:putative transposase
MTYWRLYYHVVWSTRRREPWLHRRRSDLVEQAIRHRLGEMGVILHGLSVMPDHVHVAVSVSPDDRVAWVVQQMKGSSSHFLQAEDPSAAAEGFSWQREYAVLSFSERNLDTVLGYISRQQDHHAHGTVSRGLEPCAEARPNLTGSGAGGTVPPRTDASALSRAAPPPGSGQLATLR